MSTALVVRTPAAKVVGWLCIAGASRMGIGWSAAAEAALTADVVMYLVVLAFFSLGVACVALSGSIEMDSQLIRYTTPWARYATRWDEVEAIQRDPDARRRALGTARAALWAFPRNTKQPR